MGRFLKLLCAALALLPAAVAAQYPERPINVIVAYSPGGGTDLIARAIAPFVEKYLGGGARLVIVNRAAREQGYDIELSPLRYRALWKELPWADK